jgi:hypothetical protein
MLGEDSGFAARFYRALAISLADCPRHDPQTGVWPRRRFRSRDRAEHGETGLTLVPIKPPATAGTDALSC